MLADSEPNASSLAREMTRGELERAFALFVGRRMLTYATMNAPLQGDRHFGGATSELKYMNTRHADWPKFLQSH